ncbi:unnamed protein product [Euphydryas editha]|uniref:Uncharacterized protein n=1 Tax=Euphydryas editha TaxID=104508 RepID=A0AAU9TCV8_EUPED|nr:unnamed protein product [Euphydryas editha]
MALAPLLLLASSSCYSTISRDQELELNHDLIIPNFVDHQLIQESSEINENPIIKLRRLLQKVPFKDNKKWDRDNSIPKQEKKDLPIAVILALNLKENDGYDKNSNLESPRDAENDYILKDNTYISTEVSPIAENKLEDTETVEIKQDPSNDVTTNAEVQQPMTKYEVHLNSFQDDDNEILKSIESSKEIVLENYEKAGTDNANLDSNISHTNVGTNKMGILFKIMTNSNEIQNKESPSGGDVKANDSDMKMYDSVNSNNDLVDKVEVNNECEEYDETSRNRKKYLICKEYILTEDGTNHNYYNLKFVFN